MIKCFECGTELNEEMKDKNYDTIFRCSCGAMNYLEEGIKKNE